MSIIIKKNEFSRRIKILQDSKESSSRVFDVRSLETMSNPVSGRFVLTRLHWTRYISKCKYTDAVDINAAKFTRRMIYSSRVNLW